MLIKNVYTLWRIYILVGVANFLTNEYTPYLSEMGIKIIKLYVFVNDVKITALDDIIYLNDLRAVLKRLGNCEMRVHLEKSYFVRDKIEHANYVIIIINMAAEIQALLGLVNYYARFFSNLSTILFPINNKFGSVRKVLGKLKHLIN